MTYSYSQINQYLACPRAYRHRYLEGWREKQMRANPVFGQAFEIALAAYFRRQDCGQRLYDEWSQFRTSELVYARGDSWDRMFVQGIQLLERFCQEDRVRVSQPNSQLQLRVSRELAPGREFVSYIDAIGELDGVRSILEWKTTTARYPEVPDGIVALDPQLLCYSWMTGISEVAMIVFVRKRFPEIQYLHTTISSEQREQYAQSVEHVIGQIEATRFLPHSGIRFPNNGCTTCPFVGLCLANKNLISATLVRNLGSDIDWIDELDC